MSDINPVIDMRPTDKQGRIANCNLFMRPSGDTLFYAAKDGGLIPNLDGYLIAPLEMFSKRQLSALRRRYRLVAEENAMKQVA